MPLDHYCVKGVCEMCQKPYQYFQSYNTRRKYCDACSPKAHAMRGRESERRIAARKREAKKRRAEYNATTVPDGTPGRSVSGSNPKT